MRQAKMSKFLQTQGAYKYSDRTFKSLKPSTVIFT